MKKILTYTILAACILALSACSEKLSEPAWEPEKTTEAIGFSVGTPVTKGLIESLDDEASANVEIKVYDILTGGTNNTTVTYIDDTVKGIGTTGNWIYTSGTDTHYYWTKTGTHKFFGWLTKDPDSKSITATLGADYKLKVGPLTWTAASDQIDFLYSDIVTRNAATDSHDPIALNMQHLFTALSVEVSNQAGEPITDLTVSFTNIQNGRTGTVDFFGDTTAHSYDDGTKSDYVFGGNVTSFDVPSAETPVEDTFLPLYSTDKYRLLWPQDNLNEEGKVAMVNVSCKIGGDPSDFLPVAFPAELTQMEEGTKYIMKLTITPIAVYFKIVVDPLVEYYYSENYPEYLITL